MKQISALLVVVFLLSCEWNDLLSRLVGASGCCMVVCTMPCGEMDDQSSDDTRPCRMIKNCCMQCCYVVPLDINVNSYTTITEIVFPEFRSELTSFTSSCFHPPEMV